MIGNETAHTLLLVMPWKTLFCSLSFVSTVPFQKRRTNNIENEKDNQNYSTLYLRSTCTQLEYN